MNVLITGSDGFLGKNMYQYLVKKKYNVKTFDIYNDLKELEQLCNNIDIVFHFAGVTRSEKEEDFVNGNVKLTEYLLKKLEKNKNKPVVVFASSIHADKDTIYGRTKTQSEQLIRDYGTRNNTPVFIYRLSNVFGEKSKPNYVSVVANFCYNISHNLPITITDESIIVPLIYSGDVVKVLSNIKTSIKNNVKYQTVFPINYISLGELASKVYSFKKCGKRIKFENNFDKKLYKTYRYFSNINV